MGDLITADTRHKLTTASTTGRLLLVMLAAWLDHEVGPALTAVNEDLRGLSEDDAEAVRDALRGRDDPDTLAATMVDLLDDVGSIDVVTSEGWDRVRDLAGEWLLER